MLYSFWLDDGGGGGGGEGCRDIRAIKVELLITILLLLFGGLLGFFDLKKFILKLLMFSCFLACYKWNASGERKVHSKARFYSKT